jgi:chromate transport protein ChrA
MSGHADSIRRAREVPGKEGVVKEILNAVKAAIPELIGLAIENAVKAAIPELIGLAIDVATIVAVPTLITLFWTTTFEGFLAAGEATEV